MKKGLIIAIDGPAGVGKSTVSARIARKMDYSYITTGAMYRGVALKAIQKNISCEDEAQIYRIAKQLDLTIIPSGQTQKVYIEGNDVTEILYSEEIGKGASIVSQNQGVREVMSALQRKMGEGGSIVMEGRDIGTVIFPDADIKFFLTASVEERAKRRFQEFQHKNTSASLESIKKSIKERDANDQGRRLAPLKKTDDAIVVDTTHLTVDEVVDCMLHFINSRPYFSSQR